MRYLVRRSWRLVLMLFVVGLFAPMSVDAKEDDKKKEYDPYVMYVFPTGAQRGTTIEAIARGRGLEGTSEVRISGQGISTKMIAVEEPDTKLSQRSKDRQDQSENPNVVRFSVTLDAKAELGERDIQFVTPKGATNRFRFVVGQLAEVKEVEPNSLVTEVQSLESLPVLVNGQVDQGDRDYFRFSAKAGQTIVCDVAGQSLLPFIADAVPGWLQASLTLYDAAGKEVAYSDDFRFEPDPLLIYKVEKDGDYIVEIKDVLFRGREDLVYRLSIGEIPCLTHIFPLGGKRGSELPLELHGVNLPSETTKLALSADSPSLQTVQTDQNGLASNRLPVEVDDLPEFTETEPNNESDQANKITAPVVVNGRIQQPGDVDRYLISVEAKQRLVMDVRARRLNSPVDSMLTIIDPRGRAVASNDDTVDLSEGLITHQSDSRLDYSFPAAGDYILQVGDTQGQGGDAYAYRLVVSPRRPDFLLRTVPCNPRIGQSDACVLTVKAFRRDGFNDPIHLDVQGLPAGFVVSESTVPAGAKELRLTLSAPKDAPLGLISPTIVGTAKIGEASVVHEAEPAEDVMQAFIYWHNVPTRQFLPTVVASNHFTLSADVASGQVFEVKQGATLKVGVKVARQEKGTGTIKLVGVSPPKNVTIKTANIPADANEATVSITLSKQVPVGFQDNLIITGTMTIEKQAVTRTIAAIPIRVISSE